MEQRKMCQKTLFFLKRTVFNMTKQDQMHTFLWKSFSKLCTTQKQTIHIFLASWMLAEGRGHETDQMKNVIEQTNK